MTKVFFIINCFSAGGGAEAILTSIVNKLDRKKYEIGIMEIIHNNIKKEPIREDIKMYPYFVKADDPERKTKMYRVYHKWDEVISEYIPDDYDIYISFNYLKPTFLLPPGKKCISWIHGDIFNLLEEKMCEEKELQRESFKKANRIVAISDITRKSIEEIYPEYKEKIVDIYNGIDIKRIIAQSNEKTDIRLEKKSILAIGRLDANKNPLRLLEVFEKVHKQVADSHLYYLGYGVLESEIIGDAKEKGIEEYVHCLGYYDNPFPIVKQCKVVAMMSKSEGFPMSLLETVALGKPFVSTHVGGSKILSAGGRCGKVIGTNEEAKDAIVYYLNDEDPDIKEKCGFEIQKYDLERYVKKIEKLIDEVIYE